MRFPFKSKMKRSYYFLSDRLEVLEAHTHKRPRGSREVGYQVPTDTGLSLDQPGDTSPLFFCNMDLQTYHSVKSYVLKKKPHVNSHVLLDLLITNAGDLSK